MDFQKIKLIKKRLQPRRFFFRSLLMIVLPLVLLQIVVATIFIQRHYEGAVEELSDGLAKDINIIMSMQGQGALSHKIIEAFWTQKKLTIHTYSQKKELETCLKEKKYTSLQKVMQSSFTALLNTTQGVVFCPLKDNPETWQVIVPTENNSLSIEFSQRILLNSKWHFLLVWMVSASIIFMSISLLFLKNQIRPILNLAKAAKAFGKGIDYPLNPSGAIEIKQAGHAFVQMRQRIKSQVEENNLFLAGVSHDLRTVLARVKLGLGLLPVAQDLEEEQKEILQDVSLMQKILDAYLDFAKGQESESLTQININEFLKEIIDRFQNHFKAITWIYDNHLPLDNHFIKTYPLKLRRCLENILSNACKYGHTTVCISISLGESIQITIEDDGNGIDDSIKEHIFKPFFQGNPARTVGSDDVPQGLGLGLAVTHTILRQIGAKLSVTSSPKWGGGCFEIML